MTILLLTCKFENYFIKAQKRTNIQLMGKSFNLKLNEYREIFPAGKLPSGKQARVNVKSLENSFRWFFENYDFSWSEIMNATRMYVNEYRDKEYMYMKTSQYFIAKEGKNKVKKKTKELLSKTKNSDPIDILKKALKKFEN